MTAPGVGPVTASSYRATLDRVERFPDAGRATAYLDVVPREDSSVERRQRGAVTNAGPGQPRTLLVHASWHIWRSGAGARSRGTPGTLAWPHGGADASPSSPSPDGWHGVSTPCGETAEIVTARGCAC